MKTFTVHPIDVDFAGWSIVEAGEHNAWGVVDNENFLVGQCSMKSPADRICQRLNDEQPEHPRSVFLNSIAGDTEHKALQA